MTEHERSMQIIDQISQRFGRVIDLDKSPFVMIEILRQFGHALDPDDGGGGGGGGVGGGGGGGVSTIAVGITPPEAGERIELADLMRAVLRLQRDVNEIGSKLDRLAPHRD
jgi:hypothetical protein